MLAAKNITLKRTQYGFILKIGILLLIVTFIQCSANYLKNDMEIHPEDIQINESVTLTYTPGLISAYVSTIENSNWHQVMSDSEVTVDIEATNENGDSLFTYENLLPGGSFLFYSEEPCRVIIAAG